MNKRILCVAGVLLSASACLSQERTLGDAQSLRAELAAWPRAGQEAEFRGTVEFEKVLQRPPDPSRLDHLAALGVAVPEGGVLKPAAVWRIEQLLLEWGVNGIEVVQAWRVAVADENHVRVETSIRHVRPEDPVAEPMVTVVARDGTHVWQWSSVSKTIAHNASVDAHRIDAQQLAQGLKEVRRLLNYNPLDGSQVEEVGKGEGNTIIAKMRVRNRAGLQGTSQLTFARDAGDCC